MSKLLFIDSFDHYSEAQTTRKWTQGSLAIGEFGRTGLGAGIGTFASCSKTLGQEYSILAQGVAYKTPAFANTILWASNAISSVNAFVTHIGDGRLWHQCWAPAGWFTTYRTGDPSTFVMLANRWYYVEFYVYLEAIDNGNDTYDITYSMITRVNEQEILNDVMGPYTQPYNGTTYGHFKFASVGPGGPGGGYHAGIDDYYCTDGEFLGDIKIGVLYPNASGAYQQWTPLSGGMSFSGSNYEMVREHPADDDLTILYAAATGQVEMEHLDDIDISFSGTIKGAQALWLVKKTDMGTGIVEGIWKHDAVEVSGLDFYPSALDYLYDIQAERYSLFTSGNWTVPEVNELELGIRRIG